jgi:hypothetical protein
MSIFRTVFNGFNRALDWISGEDEKLRAARDRGKPEGSIDGGQENRFLDEKEKLSVEERYTSEFDIWEEIDSYRTTFWFGSKVSRMMARSRRREKELEKELDELDRKRQEKEQMKGEGKDKT